MVRILGLLAGLALLSSRGAAGAGESYTLKLKRLGEGDTHRVEKREQADTEIKVTDANGKFLGHQHEKDGHNYAYQETLLEKKPGAKRAVRLKRHYEKALVTAKGKVRKLPYQGKTVLIERKGDRYVFRIEGGDELTGEAAGPLEQEFNKKKTPAEDFERLVLPDRAVRVGEAWTVDAAAVNKGITGDGQMEVVAEKTRATGKFVRAYEKDGRQFGVLLLSLEVVPKAFTDKGKKVAVQPGAHLLMEFTLNGCIDGSRATGTGLMSVDLHAVARVDGPDGKTVTLRITSKTTGTYKSAE